MKTEMCVLPVECKRCKGVFDLWYELQQQNSQDLAEQGFGSARMESLCWRCRRLALEEKYREYDDSANEEDDAFELDFD